MVLSGKGQCSRETIVSQPKEELSSHENFSRLWQATLRTFKHRTFKLVWEAATEEPALQRAWGGGGTAHI